jgi:hypothetical protein
MLRKWDSDGWILITHVDHAALAGEFGTQWGNNLFPNPQPRKDVLEGIHCHDDGWRERDRLPQITRQGKPSAFSIELVGKYAAFEEIDLPDYLNVRRKALDIIARRNPYAAVLISMHTYNLLSERADRSTIRTEELSLLDSFLVEHREKQMELRKQLAQSGKYPSDSLSDATFQEYFRMLQGCDNLSLMSCVDYDKPADLLHEFLTMNGTRHRIAVHPKASGVFSLDPYPLSGTCHKFTIPYRKVYRETFESAEQLQDLYAQAPVQRKEITIVAP